MDDEEGDVSFTKYMFEIIYNPLLIQPQDKDNYEGTHNPHTESLTTMATKSIKLADWQVSGRTLSDV